MPINSICCIHESRIYVVGTSGSLVLFCFIVLQHAWHMSPGEDSSVFRMIIKTFLMFLWAVKAALSVPRYSTESSQDRFEPTTPFISSTFICIPYNSPEFDLCVIRCWFGFGKCANQWVIFGKRTGLQPPSQSNLRTLPSPQPGSWAHAFILYSSLSFPKS